MTRPTTTDHLKPLKSAEPTPVRIAMITDVEESGYIQCSCGWYLRHERSKVRGDRAQAHLDKKHGGTGAWM